MNDINQIKNIIKHLELDLSGLTLLSECASGAYAYTSIIAAMAGAKVYSVGKDTRFGSFDENKKNIQMILSDLNLLDRVQFYKDDLAADKYSEIDIFLNSGMLRPITADKIKRLKKTSVIPLMWEAYEFRPEEIDLEACIENDIALIGCSENNKYFNIYDYNGYMVLKMLFEMGFDINHNRILLCGDDVLAGTIYAFLKKLSLSELVWAGSEKYTSDTILYENIESSLNENQFDVLILADMKSKKTILSDEGLIRFSSLKKSQPLIKIAHISGDTNVVELEQSGIEYYPKKIAPLGHMSYQISELGNKAVFELTATGIKVGEIAVKARLSGLSVKDSIDETLRYGLGQFIPNNSI